MTPISFIVVHSAVCFLVLMSTLLRLANGDLQPQYVGCYGDRHGTDSVMGTIALYNTSMTLEMCQSSCITSWSAFFGVEWWYKCYCSDVFDTLGRLADSSCNTPCAGNQSQTCGGNEQLSVYSVCPVGQFGSSIRCTDATCHCQHNGSYGEHCFRNGTCPGGCRAGWSGRSCTIDINECGTMPRRCEQRCINTDGSYYCSCNEGFTLNSDSRSCSDVVEDVTPDVASV